LLKSYVHSAGVPLKAHQLAKFEVTAIENTSVVQIQNGPYMSAQIQDKQEQGSDGRQRV